MTLNIIASLKSVQQSVKTDKCNTRFAYFDIKITRLSFLERLLNCSASLAMSTSILKALPGKLDIKRHPPSILYIHMQLVPLSRLFHLFCSPDYNHQFWILDTVAALIDAILMIFFGLFVLVVFLTLAAAGKEPKSYIM